MKLRTALLKGAVSQITAKAQDRLMRALTNAANNHDASWCDSGARSIMEAGLQAVFITGVLDDVMFDVQSGAPIDQEAVAMENLKVVDGKISTLIRDLERLRSALNMRSKEMAEGVIKDLQDTVGLAQK